MRKLKEFGKLLSKKEQKSINGGGGPVRCRVYCPSYCYCYGPYWDLCRYISNDDLCKPL